MTEFTPEAQSVLTSIARAQRGYEARLRQLGAEPVETFCAAELARALTAVETGEGTGWRGFVDAAARMERPPRLLFALAALHARDAGDFRRALTYAKRAMALDHRDSFAQRLFIEARERLGLVDADGEEDLSAFFCPRPFEEFELRANGNVHTCCSAWMPVPIGNFMRQSAEEIWNSEAAREVRRSVLDGDYRYCSRVHCPIMVNRRLLRRDALEDPEHRRIVAERRTVVAYGPRRVLMSQDRSCNLSCPSCRTGMIVAGKREVDRLNGLAERVIFPLLRDARQVKVTGSGDPFGSAHFRYVLKRLNRPDFPNLSLQLQTNGVLFDERAWNELELSGLVTSVWVSIDAATPATYAHTRRGGDFKRLLANLAFLSRLRAQGEFRELRLDFVVQAANFHEMPAAVELARAFGCDGAYFQMIRNWGTYSRAEFEARFIGAPDHPDYPAFLRTLRHPSLRWPGVEMSNMRPLLERA